MGTIVIMKVNFDPRGIAADTAIGVYINHQAAEAAIKKLAEDGFAMNTLSIIGKGYHSEEKVVGFYNVGDRIKLWGKQGAFWGGLWGLFLGGFFVTTPTIGPIVVLGYMATIIISALEGAVTVGGAGVLGAALYSIGIPKNSIIEYETALKSDHFLVMAHGPQSEILRAKSILSSAFPSRVEIHVRSRSLAPLSKGIKAHG